MNTHRESSTSSQFRGKYDVFLSFRGEDTRKTFISHLYSSLSRAGMITFMDDEELRKGEVVSSEKAIEECRVSLVVFSKSYASSSWCLDELVKILECKNNLNQIVIPIFYDVLPSQVRNHQIGCVGEALDRHKKRSFGDQRIDKWKAALTEAANISGWVLQNGHEAEFINNVVKKVQRVVNQTLLDVARYPVGVDSRVKDVEFLLQSGHVDEVHMIGIYGVGGLGKTTVAKAIYNQIFRDFDSSCFLSDVRSEAEASNGLVKLLEKLLHQILKNKDIKLCSVDEGINLIRRRLASKKVLIVLDDIDVRNLESLTIERSWFGLGSLIIMTTRDRNLLHGLRENERYEAKLLNDDEAMQLFSRYAFSSLSPPQEYVEVAQDVIKYSGGLPLALVVLGSHLQGRSVEEWRDKFEELRAQQDEPRITGARQQKLSSSSPYLDSTVVRSSSDQDQQQMSLYLFQPPGHSTNASHECPEVMVDTQTNNQKRRKKSSSSWSAAGSISKEDLVQLYGMKLEEAARNLRVSVSTFTRLCRVHGISRWPSAKKMRESTSVSQSLNALLSALDHKEGNPSLNHNMSGNRETTKENDMTQGRASAKQERLSRSPLYSDSLSFENPTPNSLARTPQPPENGMISEEVRETSISGQKRRLERFEDNMDEMSHFNEQPSEILNYAPERQAADSARKGSSCVTSISGIIEGDEVGYNPTPESVSGHTVNELDSTCTGVKLSLGSTSTQSLNSISSQNTKLLFSNLIALPLEDLTNPENEASMKNVLSTLADNLSVYPEEQAKQILELKFDFPILVHSWREYSRSQTYSQKFFADLKKIRDLLGTSVKDEESLKVRYGELESKEKELRAQLESVLKEKAGITEQMHEKSKQTKHLISLEEEKAARIKEKIQEMGIATTKLNSLIDQWAKKQSLFI